MTAKHQIAAPGSFQLLHANRQNMEGSCMHGVTGMYSCGGHNTGQTFKFMFSCCAQTGIACRQLLCVPKQFLVLCKSLNCMLPRCRKCLAAAQTKQLLVPQDFDLDYWNADFSTHFHHFCGMLDRHELLCNNTSDLWLLSRRNWLQCICSASLHHHMPIITTTLSTCNSCCVESLLWNLSCKANVEMNCLPSFCLDQSL